MEKENNTDESDFSENEVPSLNSLKSFEFEPKTNIGDITVVRSSHQRCSVTKDVLRNFEKFTRKHVCQSLFFNKVAGLSAAILSKKRLWHRCFPVNFAEFLRTPFFIEHHRTTASE